MSHDLVILGAGPAGVGAAYRAAREGRRVVVLEKAPGPGGAASSFEVAGVRVDVGSHRLHPSIDDRILRDLSALMGADIQTRVRNGRIRLQDRFLSFPLKASEIPRLPKAFAARAAFDTIAAPFRKRRDGSFEEVIRSRLGPAMAEGFYLPYARKIWGVEPSQLSSEQARRRVSADSPLKLIARLVAGRKGPQTFLYPRRGFGSIWETLAQAAEKEGAEIRYEARVTAIEAREGHVNVHLGDEEVQARMLWSTIPAGALARLWRPSPEGEVLAAAQALRFRAMVLVYLALQRERYTPFDAHYLPERYTSVTRLSEPKNYRDGPDPADRTVLCAEIPCDVGDEVWSASDGELRDVVLRGISAAGLPPTGPLIDVRSRRLPYAYPIYLQGYEAHFERLDRWLDAQPHALTFGRQGLFAHDNSHHALAMAYDATDALRADGSFDRAAWAVARRRFEDHVVED